MPRVPMHCRTDTFLLDSLGNLSPVVLLLPGGCVAAGITLAAGACMPFVAPFATRTGSLVKLSEADFQQAVALGPTPSDQCCLDAGAFTRGVSTRPDAAGILKRESPGLGFWNLAHVLLNLETRVGLLKPCPCAAQVRQRLLHPERVCTPAMPC